MIRGMSFHAWSGDYTGTSLSGLITMDANKDCYCGVSSAILLDRDGATFECSFLNGSGWYNAGDAFTITVPSQIVGGGDGTRLVFNGWSVDGNNQSSSTLNLQMNGPHTVIAQYKQQYYLTVLLIKVFLREQVGMMLALMRRSVSQHPLVQVIGVNMVFNGWQGRRAIIKSIDAGYDGWSKDCDGNLEN